jgi:hypothetical protein
MRSLMLLAPVLSLAGCNLFQSGLIAKTCEDVPAGCAGIDTDPGTDDTDDTAPWIPDDPFTKGMVVASVVGAQVQVRVFDADRATIQEAGFALSALTMAGPVAYDPVQPRILQWDNGSQQLFVAADGADTITVTVDTSEDAELGYVYDSVLIDSALYLVSATAVWSYLPDAGAITKLGSDSSLVQVRSVFPAFEDNLFLLNWNASNQPDLYRHTISSAETRLSYEDFDDSLGRSAAGFQGPDLKPYVCSSVGGVYSVEDLEAADRSPAAFPAQGDVEGMLGVPILSGVTDCGWDDGAERYLLHSAEHGVLAMDAWGRVDLLLGLEADEQFVRAAFYTPYSHDTGA